MTDGGTPAVGGEDERYAVNTLGEGLEVYQGSYTTTSTYYFPVETVARWEEYVRGHGGGEGSSGGTGGGPSPTAGGFSQSDGGSGGRVGGVGLGLGGLSLSWSVVVSVVGAFVWMV